MTRQHLLQAIAEYDSRGAEQFLQLYGFAPSTDHPLVHEGRSYDSRALLGVAHRFATGRLAPAEEFNSDVPGSVAILRKRGFEVTGPASPVRAAPAPARAARTPRTTVAKPRASAVREIVPVICPTCSMTLPATGVCDYCA